MSELIDLISPLGRLLGKLIPRIGKYVRERRLRRDVIETTRGLSQLLEDGKQMFDDSRVWSLVYLSNNLATQIAHKPEVKVTFDKHLERLRIIGGWHAALIREALAGFPHYDADHRNQYILSFLRLHDALSRWVKEFDELCKAQLSEFGHFAEDLNRSATVLDKYFVEIEKVIKHYRKLLPELVFDRVFDRLHVR